LYIASIFSKINLIKDLESGEVEFRLTKKFLLELRKEFGRGNEEFIKVAKLRKIE